MSQSIFPDSLDRFAVGRTPPDALADAINRVQADLRGEGETPGSWGYTVRHYGARRDGTTDDLPAFRRAIDAMPDGTAGDNFDLGGRIEIPPGTYYLNGPLELTKPVHLVGHGQGQYSPVRAASRLIFPAGSPGIVVPVGGGPVTVEGLWISSQSTAAGTDDGILVQGKAFVRRCVVTGFGRDGVRFDSSGGGNCNLSRAEDVVVRECRQHGFHLKGGSDTNAITLLNCDATSNTGWGFYSDAAHANLYLKPHADSNAGGGIRFANSNSPQVYHHYVEPGTGDTFQIDADSYYGLVVAGVFGVYPHNLTWGGSGASRTSWITLMTGGEGGAGNGFSGPGLEVYGPARVAAASARLILRGTGAVANRKVWRLLQDDSDGTLALGSLNDAEDTLLGTAWFCSRNTSGVPTLMQIGSSVGISGNLQLGSGATLTGLLSGTTTWDPGNLTVNSETSTTVTVTGAAVGDPVIASFSQDLQELAIWGYVSSANTVTVWLRNGSPGAVDLSSGTLRAVVLKF